MLALAEGVVVRIGYDPKDFLFDVLIHRQSQDIAQGIQTSREKRGNPAAQEDCSMGARDQGIMTGYACKEKPQMLPMPVLPADPETKSIINPSGRFVAGGMEADTG